MHHLPSTSPRVRPCGTFMGHPRSAGVEKDPKGVILGLGSLKGCPKGTLSLHGKQYDIFTSDSFGRVTKWIPKGLTATSQ